jgi:hypothetical protein
MEIQTLTEGNKGILRPITKEPLWLKIVGILPVPRYETR